VVTCALSVLLILVVEVKLDFLEGQEHSNVPAA